MAKTNKMLIVDKVTIPDWADSGLLTLGDRSELMYVYRKGDETLSKFVSPDDVARAYARVTYDTGVIPEGIIRMGRGPAGHWGILRMPAQVVKMSFLSNNPIKAPIPQTILFGIASDYYIFAEYKGKLYHAPFDNVYDDGSICWGNNTVPTMKNAETLQKVWNLFWLIPFTHRNDTHGGKLTYKPIYEALAKARKPKFNRKLKETKITMKQILSMATKEGNLDD